MESECLSISKPSEKEMSVEREHHARLKSQSTIFASSATKNEINFDKKKKKRAEMLRENVKRYQN